MIESHRRDRGFTLTEVLIVVVLMGVLMSAVAAVFSVIVRTAPTTENRVDDSVALLGLTTRLPPDVNSTPGVDIALAAAHWNTQPSGSGCASGDVGENLVVLKWSEQTGSSPTMYTANYRLAANGVGGSTMWRISCTNAGPGTARRIVQDLPSMPSKPVTVTIRNGLDPVDEVMKVVGLSMTVTTMSGDVLRFDAQTNNPAETLGTIPVTATTAATTTTTTTTVAPATTTTVAPSTSVGGTTTTSSTSTTTPTTTFPPTTTTIPCSADFINGPGDKPVQNPNVQNGGGGNVKFGPLDDNVLVTITKSGSCAGLRLEFVRAPTSENAAERQPVRLSFGDGVTTILRSAQPTERWEDGSRALRLYDTGNGTYLGSTESVNIQ